MGGLECRGTLGGGLAGGGHQDGVRRSCNAVNRVSRLRVDHDGAGVGSRFEAHERFGSVVEDVWSSIGRSCSKAGAADRGRGSAGYLRHEGNRNVGERRVGEGHVFAAVRTVVAIGRVVHDNGFVGFPFVAGGHGFVYGVGAKR
jgi:hypothetical protein